MLFKKVMKLSASLLCLVEIHTLRDIASFMNSYLIDVAVQDCFSEGAAYELVHMARGGGQERKPVCRK